ncbi:MAG TPA: ATP-grasp domain-containing protein [Pyrinomonadaceae bacterium]|nr:ATP-grasp domain-containing protein [Pyrinomonadaceae bacterium]
MRNVLVICPTGREYRDLPSIAARLNCRVIFEDFAADVFDDLLTCGEAETPLDILALIEQTIERHSRSNLSGVTCAVGYPGMSVASIIAKHFNLPGPDIECVLMCEHKYYSRIAQQSLVPHAVPPFQLIDPHNPNQLKEEIGFPLFLKPVKSCFSINAHRVDSASELRRYAAQSLLPQGFLKPFNDLLKTYTEYEWDGSYLLAESLLTGRQVSLEGYVYRGRVHTLGIIDSVMYPGTISFKRFEYPSSLSAGVQERMARIAETFIEGIGYDNALFNIEFMYDPATDLIRIIEINPKIASQFPDLFEKVDGTNTYSVLLSLALGVEPVFTRRKGDFKLAASCVLRTFEDQRVLAVPNVEQIASLTEKFPDSRIEICAVAGKKLSEVMQDGKSYRYGLINIGADSPEELEAKFQFLKGSLDFQFARV